MFSNPLDRGVFVVDPLDKGCVDPVPFGEGTNRVVDPVKAADSLKSRVDSRGSWLLSRKWNAAGAEQLMRRWCHVKTHARKWTKIVCISWWCPVCNDDCMVQGADVLLGSITQH